MIVRTDQANDVDRAVDPPEPRSLSRYWEEVHRLGADLAIVALAETRDLEGVVGDLVREHAWVASRPSQLRVLAFCGDPDRSLDRHGLETFVQRESIRWDLLAHHSFSADVVQAARAAMQPVLERARRRRG